MSTNYDAALARQETSVAVPLRNRISWPAIFAGVIIVIAIQLVLALLGAGIGLSLVDPVQGTTPSAGGFGIGAGIYWIVSTIVALGAGSYAAARVAGVHDRFDGIVHGLTIWGVTLMLTLYLVTSAVGGIIGGAFRTVGTVASAAGQGVGASAPTIAKVAGISPDDLQDQASAYLETAPADPAAMTPQEAQKEIAKELPALAAGGAKGQQAEGRIVTIVAAQQKISRPEAQQKVDTAKARFVQAKNDTIATAKSAADAAAGGAAGTSFMVVIALLIGAAASAFGAVSATRRREVVVRV
ncbi:hypothetical protein [Sphingomonas sp. GB1N7]|uniref:hypothetical protein n=1 Tax=Parasphingomonas caseinilytica TaxID=3096158 RepID=UPI002FC8836A